LQRSAGNTKQQQGQLCQESHAWRPRLEAVPCGLNESCQVSMGKLRARFKAAVQSFALVLGARLHEEGNSQLS